MADLWKQVAKYVLNKRPAFNSKIDRLLLFYCADFPNPRNPSPSVLPSAARLPFSHQLPTKLYFFCPRPSLQYFTDHTLPPATHFTIFLLLLPHHQISSFFISCGYCWMSLFNSSLLLLLDDVLICLIAPSSIQFLSFYSLLQIPTFQQLHQFTLTFLSLIPSLPRPPPSTY